MDTSSTRSTRSTFRAWTAPTRRSRASTGSSATRRRPSRRVKAGARQLQSYGTGAQNVAAVALPLGLQLEHLVTEGRTTVGDLEAIKGPFEHAVKKSEACQALKPSADGQ